MGCAVVTASEHSVHTLQASSEIATHESLSGHGFSPFNTLQFPFQLFFFF